MIAGALLFSMMAPGSGLDRPAAPGFPSPCLRARTALSSGATPRLTDFDPAPCNDVGDAAFRFDRDHHVPRAARDIRVGETVRPWADASGDRIQPGDALTFRVDAGPVRIVRQVIALQAARPGQRLFVKDSDGQIFSAPYESVAP